MARYRILSLSYIDNRLVEPGTVITVGKKVEPGTHWEPLDADARAACARAGLGMPRAVPDDAAAGSSPSETEDPDAEADHDGADPT